MLILSTIGVFSRAGMCELGGGYLVWLSDKEGKSVWRSIFDPNQT